MDREKLAAELLATFVEELEIHVAALNRDMLALERAEVDGGDAGELLHSLFRTTHTIKGSSRAAGATSIEQASHRIEDVLTLLREKKLLLAPRVFELLFAVTDALADTGERLRKREDITAGSLADVVSRLSELASPRAVEGGSLLPPPLQASAAAAPMTSAVRIGTEKLDDLVAGIGELSVLQARLADRENELDLLRTLALDADADGRLARVAERFLSVFRDDRRKIGAAVAALDADIKRVRMVPFSEGCAGLDRVVRDLAAAGGKQIELAIGGGEVELDRAVLEGLRDPLLHLVRNAVDHAIEPAEQRAAAGKPARGRIVVTAALRGAEIAVTVEDDGRGIDLEAVRAQLRRRKMPEPMRAEDLARSIFAHGFSTARLITDVSGRGVGLDVVKKRVESMRGTIDLSFRAGEGTRIALVVPLTLTTIRGLLVRAGGQTFVIPGTAVRELLRTPIENARPLSGVETLLVRGAAIPIVSLASAVGRPGAPVLTGGKASVVVVTAQGCDVALVVDELLDEREVVVKTLGPRLRFARYVSGATVLPSGRLALILSMGDVVERARTTMAPTSLRSVGHAETSGRRARVLLVDDSVTTRALERSILEAGGFTVIVAFDGAEGWRILQEQPVDVVVSDVEMPRMDGFTLTETIRSTPRFRDLPVVLVTGRASPADRKRGLDVGANAYLVKSDFDQQHLLETLAQLL